MGTGPVWTQQEMEIMERAYPGAATHREAFERVRRILPGRAFKGFRDQASRRHLLRGSHITDLRHEKQQEGPPLSVVLGPFCCATCRTPSRVWRAEEDGELSCWCGARVYAQRQRD